MKRREFISLLGGAAAAWPLAAHAQQSGRVRRVAVLMGYAETDLAAQAQVAAFRQELQKLGWGEGSNIRIDVRFPGADAGGVRAALMELMTLAPDLIVSNTNLVTAIVKAEIRAIPIVFISVGDPVGSGFVSNEARPDGNVTGFANWESAISGKWLELLKELAPNVERVAFMMEPQTPILVGFFKSAEAVAPSLKVKLVRLDVRDADEIQRSLAAFAAESNGDLIISPSAVTFSNRDLIIALGARFRLPCVCILSKIGRPDFVRVRSGKPLSAGGGICRSHTARRQACRLAFAVSNQVSARRQSQNRQSPRPRHPRIVPAARRRGH
jgi:putative ABC transport system substrate-binding protein